jgi:hypothetical protein
MLDSILCELYDLGVVGFRVAILHRRIIRRILRRSGGDGQRRFTFRTLFLVRETTAPINGTTQDALSRRLCGEAYEAVVSAASTSLRKNDNSHGYT